MITRARFLNLALGLVIPLAAQAAAQTPSRTTANGAPDHTRAAIRPRQQHTLRAAERRSAPKAFRLASITCNAPSDEFQAVVGGPGVFQYDPPPDARDVEVTVTFSPAPGYRKRILIRQGNSVAARIDSNDGPRQSTFFQSNGSDQVEFEFGECTNRHPAWGARRSFIDSNLAADTSYMAFEDDNEAQFVIRWGPGIHRAQLPATVASNDVDNALTHIRWAWSDNGPCTRFVLCATYIDEVGISFTNGNFGPFIKIQRLTNSAHDCIQHAKDELVQGHRGVAVEWVIASQIHNPPVYDWLRAHPDAVVTALGRI